MMSYRWKCKNRKTEDIVCSDGNIRVNDNHSIAYCLLGYLCAYYRYYHPVEFITSFLNNAANEDDIREGTSYANKLGIKVTMPKWGYSRNEYSFDRDARIIAKGLASVKYMSANTGEMLYALAHSKPHDRFMDVLFDIDTYQSVPGVSIVDTRKIDILIKTDFFSQYGNQRELLTIADLFYDIFKRGQVKKINKERVDGTAIADIIRKYSTGVTQSGGEAKSYTILDVRSAMNEAEDAVKASGLNDLDDITKVKNFAEAMGYVGYVSDKEEDRRKLYLLEVYPLKRKADGKQFGYSFVTKSIGSGKESRFTVPNKVYEKSPVRDGDIIKCIGYEQNGQYYRMTSYEKIV